MIDVDGLLSIVDIVMSFDETTQGSSFGSNWMDPLDI